MSEQQAFRKELLELKGWRTLVAILLGGLLITTAVLAFVGLRPHHWEYEIMAPSDSWFVSQMGDEGRAGWEVVNCRRASGPDGMKYECIMKRRSWGY